MILAAILINTPYTIDDSTKIRIFSGSGGNKEQCYRHCVILSMIKSQECTSELAEVPSHDASRLAVCLENSDGKVYEKVY
jgi:hypothetical protein